MLDAWLQDVLPREEDVIDLAGVGQVAMLAQVELEVRVDFSLFVVVDVVGGGQDKVGGDEGPGAFP